MDKSTMFIIFRIKFPRIGENAHFFTTTFISNALQQTEIHLFHTFDDCVAQLDIGKGVGDHGWFSGEQRHYRGLEAPLSSHM